MSSNNLDICTKNNKTDNKDNTVYDNIPTSPSMTTVLNTNINIESLDIVNIKRETYYKMKFIINSLEKNWAIKKRKTIFYLKNLEDSTTEIITEDYLNRRFINNQRNNHSQSHGEVRGNLEVIKKKEDIVSLREGIHTLKILIDKGKLNINGEQKSDIYLMIFLMNTLENGWSIRKKNDNYVFRKKHDRQTEIYSDEYLVNFLKSNMNNITY
jgi:hypothetical protein